MRSEPIDIIERLRRMADDLMRTLTPGEQAVVFQILARAAVPGGVCDIRIPDLARASGLSPAAAQRIINALSKRGTIQVISGKSRHHGNSYMLPFPFVLGPTQYGARKFERRTGAPRHEEEPKEPYRPPLYESLNQVGKAKVDQHLSALPEDELRRVRLLASKRASSDGDMLAHMRELIAETFGPQTLDTYRQTDGA